MPKAKKSKKAAAPAADDMMPPPKAPKPQMVPAVRMLLDSTKNSEIWRASIDVAALALEPPSIAPLTACGAIAGLAKHLRSASAQVRVSAVRGLKNIVLTGGAEVAASVAAVCPAVALCSVWKDTADLLHKIQAAPVEEKKKKKKKATADATMEVQDETGGQKDDEFEAYFVDDETEETVGQALVDVTLLIGSVAYFCEDVAAQLSGNVDLISALIDCLHAHAITSHNSTLAIAAADLLLLLCEDNEVAQHAVRTQVSKERQASIARLALEPAASPNHTLCKVTALGLLAALDPSQLPQICAQLMQHGMTITPQADYENLRKLLVKSEKPELKKVALQQFTTKLKTLKATLEICVNIVCSADTDEAIDDDEVAFRKTAVGQMVIQSGFGRTVAAKAAELLGQCPSRETEDALRDPLDEKTDLEIEAAYGDVESAVVVLLMNLVMVLPLKAIGEAMPLFTLLQNVFARDAKLADKLIGNEDMAPREAKALTRLENLLSVMWTALRKDEVEGAGLDLDPPFLNSLITFLGTRRMTPTAAKNDALVVNTLSFLSEARCFFETDNGGEQDQVIQFSGQFCMDCLKDGSLEVNVEAMNTIIDIFSDDQWDPVMKGLNMVRHLVDFCGFLQNKLDILKSTGAPIPEEVEPRLETVTSNLQPFIDYKRGRGL